MLKVNRKAMLLNLHHSAKVERASNANDLSEQVICRCSSRRYTASAVLKMAVHFVYDGGSHQLALDLEVLTMDYPHRQETDFYTLVMRAQSRQSAFML